MTPVRIWLAWLAVSGLAWASVPAMKPPCDSTRVRTCASFESKEPEPTLMVSWAWRMTGGPCRVGTVSFGRVAPPVVPWGRPVLFDG